MFHFMQPYYTSSTQLCEMTSESFRNWKQVQLIFHAAPIHAV